MTLRRLSLTLILLAALPTLAKAQAPASSPQPLPDQSALDRVKIGQKVRVTNTQGLELRGKVSALSPTDIEVMTAAGPKRMATSDVWTISKKDSNTNGFYVGFITGAVVVLIGYLSIEESSYVGKPSGSQALGVCAIWGLVTGGLGALIDSSTDRPEVTYQKADRRLAVQVAPIATLGSSKRVGVAGSITWR